MKRCWINQPSTLQPLHKLHGVCVLVDKNKDCTICYFLEGDVISQHIDPIALSEGWPFVNNSNQQEKQQ